MQLIPLSIYNKIKIDMPSTLWTKRVITFNVKFSASNNMFCKATESNHAYLM